MYVVYMEIMYGSFYMWLICMLSHEKYMWSFIYYIHDWKYSMVPKPDCCCCCCSIRVLQPFNKFLIISSVVYPNHKFPGQACFS